MLTIERSSIVTHPEQRTFILKQLVDRPGLRRDDGFGEEGLGANLANAD